MNLLTLVRPEFPDTELCRNHYLFLETETSPRESRVTEKSLRPILTGNPVAILEETTWEMF